MTNDLYQALIDRLDRMEDKVDTLLSGSADQRRDHAVLVTIVENHNTRLKKLESKDLTWFIGIVLSMGTIAVGLSKVMQRLGF